MSEQHLRLVAGRSARYIAHTVLPLHLTTVCDLNFQACLKTCKKRCDEAVTLEDQLQSRILTSLN